VSRALGRYELLRPIARGGMAEVFLARRRAAGVEKWLVVKRMRPERAGDARFLELFVREARLSMSLAHQNIVPVFDFGRIDDQVFIAMERVEGKDLGSSLGRSAGPLPPLLAAFVAAECCQALDYAHLRRAPDGTPLGIVHRDVTPRNVMLSWSGEVKLTDFGIASLAGDAAAVIGTPGYMAPEQARGEPLDPRADIYAIGMVLREALTGVRPRPGGEREATLAAARAGELVPWPEEFSSPLVAIVDRATSAAREARYPDARAMLEELDAYIVGERAANKTDAPARRLAAWLAETWKEEREETAIDEAIEGSHLVSFLDDGGLDAMGTGTERSMAATAGEDELAARVPAESGTPSQKIVVAGDLAPPPPVEEARAPARPRWILPVAAVAVLGVGAFAIARVTGGDHGSPVPPTAPGSDERIAMPGSAGSAVAIVPAPPPIDAAPPPLPDAAVQVAFVNPPTNQGSGAGSAKRPRPAKPPVVTPPPSLPKLHAVKVNTSPWAYFTVDDNPTQFQTMETIHLSAGPHVIHFSREDLQARDVPITVPDADSLVVFQPMTRK
jgi:tRNA A-37 threonylcarbamoyl transferase component Bud32